jgi:CTD small phosphatase-like protein 2
VLDQLDQNKSIAYRLCRQHTVKASNAFIKDISKLGRDLDKMIIIDNVEDNYQLQKENGLNIKNFLGEEDDNELNELLPDLISN